MMSRYDRQIKTSKFGIHAQKRLMQSVIMIIGTGALGSTVAEMLARSGVGKLILCDMDVVSETNLHRQSLFDENDSANHQLKVEALKTHISRINKTVRVETNHKEITAQNILPLLETYQPTMIVDGTDNFQTRYIINDACHKKQIPWIYGACLGITGTVYGIDYSGPCLKCILQETPTTGQDCAIEGIMPQTAHIVASFQVAEVMRYMKTNQFSQKLITIDCFDMVVQHKNIQKLKNPNCTTCVKKDYEALQQAPTIISKLCGNQYIVRLPSNVFTIEIPGTIKQNQYFKIIENKNGRANIMHDGRVILKDIESKQQIPKIIYDYFGITIE